jgi:hypothetical protein
MSGFFSFDFFHQKTAGTSKERCAVMYCSREDLHIGSFLPHLRAYLERNPPPDVINILAPESNRPFLTQLLTEAKFLDRLPSTLREKATSVVKRISIGKNGEFLEISSNQDAPVDKGLRTQIYRAGLKTMFSKRGGLFPASPAFHYVKPSGKHCDRFVRSAEILVDGGEIDFVASRLLEYLDDTTDFIFCDSASISQLAYSLMKIRKGLQPEWVNPVVDTFRSYGGIDTHDFHVAQNPLCLISASTSGDMAKRLIDKGLRNDRIVTLFYVGDPGTPGEVLYDLTRHEHTNPDGIDKIVSYAPGDCPLCKQGSSRIKMSRDHFVPEDPTAESVLLRAEDAPRWLKQFLDRYSGTGVIRAHYGGGMRGFTHNIYFDMRRALNAAPDRHFNQCFGRVLTQHLPVSLRRIIALNDSGSVEMAKVALALYTAFNNQRDIKILTAREAIDDANNLVESQGSTVVIASCIVGGRSLMELSQILRTIQANGCISFIVGIARFTHRDVLNEARSNVTRTSERSTDFGFHIVDQVFVPDNTPLRPSSWDDEIEFLKQLQRIFSADREAASILAARLEQLRLAGGDPQCGLEDELFWTTVDNKRLKLRPNFAFYRPPKGANPLTQAEVFFTMSCVLHNLRQNDPSHRSLAQSEHNRTLIEPTTFYRLNDGVIQAALLRAALASEIDYRIDEAKSATMQEVIKSIFTECSKDRGEATIEFLLALSMQHLRLTPSDTKRLIEGSVAKLERYPISRCLCRFLMDDLKLI